MRKLLIIGLFCFTSIIAKAQKDYCADIHKVGSELTGKTFYMSNAVWLNDNNTIIAMKVITPQLTGMSLEFRNFASVLELHKKGLYIKFDDGTFYRNPENESDVKVSNSNRWQYDNTLIITKDMYDKFTLHKIIAVNFGFSQDVQVSEENAEKIINYLICCNSLN